MKYFSLFIIFCFTIINFSFAGCGSCNVSKKKPISPDANFVTSITEDGKINDVKGTDIDDHGDSHAEEGFCNAIRVAKVKGEIKKNRLEAESFVVQKN